MTTTQKVDIVGVGDDGPNGLSGIARELVDSAEILIGPENLWRPWRREAVVCLDPGLNIDQLASAIEAHAGRRIVVLTAGDPLFFGTARYLCDVLGKDRFNVIPHVSSMQMAFARVKESWDEAYLANLDGVGLPRALDRVRTCEKAGLFTTPEIPPDYIARQMLDSGLDMFFMYVCENLGAPNERVTRGELGEIAELSFSPLNVVILVRKPGVPDLVRPAGSWRLFGYPDEAYQQSVPKRGLLTPMEVRVLALSLMEIRPSATIWDVGAGSGSVAIESAMLASAGIVYAIERDVEDFQLIQANCQRIGVHNVRPILGEAPHAWESLPDPDAIFIGGTGRAVAGMATAAWRRLPASGRMVVHVNGPDNLVDTTRVLRQQGADVTTRMIQVSCGVDQIDTWRWESSNPTFLICAARS